MSVENKERKTYIINIDGMRADYFGAEGHQGCLTPTLVLLAEQGVQFTNCKDILPAVTATNHTSILTSASLGTHGIYGMGSHYQGLDFSHLRVSSRHGTAQMDKYHHRHLQGLPTFFNVVKKNNPKSMTALITGKHWIDFLADESCDVLIYAGNSSNPDYVIPSEGHILGGERHEGDCPIPPRLYLPKKGDRYISPPKGTIKVPIDAINADLVPSDKWTIDQAIQTICYHEPDFMYVLLSNIDTAGHVYGSFSDTNTSDLCKIINPDAMKDQLFITDSEIKRFIDFLKRQHTYDESRIIITSDHGMSTMKEFKKSSDVRKTLAEHGINIRANTKWLPFGYNDRGQYEWCFSEGTQVYIYCRDEIEKEIKDTIQADLPHLQEVLDKQSQIDRNMWKGDYEDVLWPRLIVFLEQNYYNMSYGDVTAVGTKIVATLPDHIQFLIAKAYGLPGLPGTHGTYSEQDVPLIFVSPSEPDAVPDKVEDHREVSVIDIIPTINSLNGWKPQPTFEGKIILPPAPDEPEEPRKPTKKNRSIKKKS